MTKVARTGAERYLRDRAKSPEYRDAYDRLRAQIDAMDNVIQALDARRNELELTKAELARRSGLKPEAIRRLFSADRPNPTLATLVAVADALGLSIAPRPSKGQRDITRAQSAGS